jgi:hypothetical protein
MPSNCDSSRLLRNAGVAENGFKLEEFLQSGLTPFPAVARLLVAAKATSEVDSGAIDVHIPRSNPLRDLVRTLQISPVTKPDKP